MGSPIVLLLIPTFHKLQTKVNFFLKGVWEKRRNIETSWFGFVRGPELLLRLRGVIGSGTGESLPSCRPRHLLRVLAGRAEELALINIKTSEMPSCCCAEIGPRPKQCLLLVKEKGRGLVEAEEEEKEKEGKKGEREKETYGSQRLNGNEDGEIHRGSGGMLRR
ncbi:hypothetical protein Q8A67_017751 [Cirrhinus molitorella]|uniref:Uncharacterized protein n=1 Tax=Cirrhinus molitorella TaxID=172907 RepID=A0AA88PQQ0_9TELE|nr:hypothetical protein Q8A67_017751 [Cirrhinus molitorella]